jgi:hypothetical protein
MRGLAMRRSVLALPLRSCLWLGALLGGCGQDQSSPPLDRQPFRWSEPVSIGQLGPDSYGMCEQVQLGVDGQGNATVLWLRPERAALSIGDASDGTLWSSQGQAEGAWSPQAVLAAEATHPELAVSPAGQAVAVWCERPARSHRVRIVSSRAPAGGTWGNPVEIRWPRGAGRTEPKLLAVSVDGTGNAVMAFDDVDLWQIFISRSSSGGMWSNPVGLPDTGWVPGVGSAGNWNVNCHWHHIFARSSRANGGQMRMDGGGNIHLIWYGFPHDYPMIYEGPRLYAGRLTSANAWSDPVVLEREYMPLYPSLAVNSAGQAAAVWLTRIQQPPSLFPPVRATVHASIRDERTGWSTASPLGNAGIIHKPSVAIDQRGRALAIWVSADEYSCLSPFLTGAKLQFSRYLPGQGWSSSSTLVTLDEDSSDAEPELAMDSQGRAIALWTQLDGNVFRLVAAHYDGSGWAEPVLVSTNEVGEYAGRPRIAMTPDGRAVAVWQQARTVDGVAGADVTLWASRYDPPGAP